MCGTIFSQLSTGYEFKFIDLFSENKLWYQPECTGSESDGEVGPSPRAFHVAVSIDCHMFIFGGRSGGKRYVDIHCAPVSFTYKCSIPDIACLPLIMKLLFQVG